jgi:hypothetical protein
MTGTIFSEGIFCISRLLREAATLLNHSNLPIETQKHDLSKGYQRGVANFPENFLAVFNAQALNKDGA